NEEGELIFSLTWSEATACPLIDITDTGKFLVPVLLNPDEYNGQSFTAATAFYTPAEMVEGWRKITGKRITFLQNHSEELGLPPEMAKMLSEGAKLVNDYQYYGPTGRKALDWTLSQMDDKPGTWENFVKANEPWF
ncbi:MAG: hypothetical protein Q9219_007693, partial [cf. Caloplaca sp. 3 TL-2023]